MPDPVQRMLAEWSALRQEIQEMERVEHPNLTDRHGRTWVWKARDLYSHCQMAFTEDIILSDRLGLPSKTLAGNPNYDLCETCRQEW